MRNNIWFEDANGQVLLYTSHDHNQTCHIPRIDEDVEFRSPDLSWTIGVVKKVTYRYKTDIVDIIVLVHVTRVVR
jgi:hypothetical protein